MDLLNPVGGKLVRNCCFCRQCDSEPLYIDESSLETQNAITRQGIQHPTRSEILLRQTFFTAQCKQQKHNTKTILLHGFSQVYGLLQPCHIYVSVLVYWNVIPDGELYYSNSHRLLADLDVYSTTHSAKKNFILVTYGWWSHNLAWLKSYRLAFLYWCYHGSKLDFYI